MYWPAYILAFFVIAITIKYHHSLAQHTINMLVIPRRIYHHSFRQLFNINVLGTRHAVVRSTSTTSSTTTVDPLEVDKFSKMSQDWWNTKGDMKPLHQMNPVRIKYIRDCIASKYKTDKLASRPFKDINILDIGCGAGILTEPLARLGGNVVGIDAVPASIVVATQHALQDPSIQNLTYLCKPAEELATEKPGHFDIITCLEVIEHVSDISVLLDACKKLIKPGGSIFISTINRTYVSNALAVFAAENILRVVPKGTHDWSKFVTPDETRQHLSNAGFEMVNLSGLSYNPFMGHWSLWDSTMMNYICHAFKKY